MINAFLAGMEQIYAVDYFDFRISLILTWGCHAEALEV